MQFASTSQASSTGLQFNKMPSSRPTLCRLSPKRAPRSFHWPKRSPWAVSCSATFPEEKTSNPRGHFEKQLRFTSGCTMLPHPEKMEKGGEDAFFIAANGLAVGVADGVGGSACNGVDPGAYSRSLMHHANRVADNASDGVVESPRRMLKIAHSHTILPGSSTACIISLNNYENKIMAANLGDSGFFVLQGEHVTFKTKPQQHGFNFPYQLGLNTLIANRPEQAQTLSLPAQLGDIVVMGTDGLWDNLFLDECVDVIRECRMKNMTPKEMSRLLLFKARARSLKTCGPSPFKAAAIERGYHFPGGGKPDDITVLVSIVEESPI